MELELRINGVVESLAVSPNQSLLTFLREQGYQSVRRGCETGECGACTVLVDGVPRPSCVMLAAQAGGCTVTTVENIGSAHNLHPLQETFAEVGAVQCGFCTPGMLLSSHALLIRNLYPTEQDVRDALSGNLCRCTGYAKPIQAVLRAAAKIRGETVAPLAQEILPSNGSASAVTGKISAITGTIETVKGGQHGTNGLQVIGKSLQSRSAVRLTTGRNAFTCDSIPANALYGQILTSPHAHAKIRSIDVTEARALPGVQAVLTYKDIERRAYTGVERFPWGTGPRDSYCLDDTVRYVGDRVAAVAAERPEIAEQAVRLIQVEYDLLPAIFDARQALEANAPRIHTETTSPGITDAERNTATRIHVETGDIERGFAEAELVIEGEYILPQTQAVPIEKHTVVTYFDEDATLVVRTDTKSIHHLRHTLSQVLDLPARRVKIVKADSGGDFGAKQGIVLEDIAALLTLVTQRPIVMSASRAEEFCSRVRQTHIVRLKTGVRRDGTLIANQLMLLANTGAYATHALTNIGAHAAEILELYPCAHRRFVAEVLYTNLPPAAPSSGYESAPLAFALESHMDEIARQLAIDALELRRKNWLRVGSERLLLKDAGEGGQAVETCGLAQCLQTVEEHLQWKEKRNRGGNGRLKRGVGAALSLYTPFIRGATSGAMIKLDEDGVFDIFAGDGYSSDGRTLLTQIVAEVLSVPIEDIFIHATSTAEMPTESGASSVAALHVSGGAVLRAAEQMRRQILAVAGRMVNVLPELLKLQNGNVSTPDKKVVSIAQIAQHALFVEQRQIMTTTTWKEQTLPTTFAAQGVEVEIDTETGVVRVLKAISAVDVGLPMNPMLIEGQIEGSVTQALGAALFEEVLYDQHGQLLTKNITDYHLYNAPDMPALRTILIQTNDSAVPFGMKSTSSSGFNAIAPAVANAVANALGTRIRHLPLTPERVLRAIHAQNRK